MKYFIPIDKKTKYIPSHILDIFLRNQGDFTLFPEKKEARYTHQNGDIETLLIVNNFSEFPDYEMIDNFPDVKKIKPYTDLYYDTEKEVWVYDENIDIARAKKLQELEDYDSSPAVNSFTINGVEMWLSKEERNSLYRLATASKNMGQKTMQLQLADGSFFEATPDNILAMLDALEVYAGASFGVTGNKKIEIKAITTIEEIEAYDVTTGYPKQLNF